MQAPFFEETKLLIMQIQNHIIENNKVFPNYLDQRNVAALAGAAIVIDLFQIPVVNSKKPRDSFKAVIAVDLATSEIIAHGVFRIPNALKGEPPAYKVVSTLRSAFSRRTFQKGFILHSDRGCQFTSDEYHALVKEFGATGSMSQCAKPKHNSVAERNVRTIKQQLLRCPATWPKKVQSFGAIRDVFHQRVDYYNHQFKPKRAIGLTPAKLAPALKAVEHLAPQLVLAHANHDVNHQAVIDFKQRALTLREHPYQIITTTRDSVERVEASNLQIHQKLNRVQEQLQELLKAKQRPTSTRVRRPLRDPATNTVYNWLMQQPRPLGEWRISFLRFRLAITLLRHTGMRAAEVAEINSQQIQVILQHGHLDVTLAKTRKMHRYVFTDHARKALQALEVERIHVFAAHKRLAGPLHGDNWVRFLNRKLQPAVTHFRLNLKSHSFRVGYVTHLLKFAPVQQVASIVGHRDIRNTIAYNRYVPDRKVVLQLLERGDHTN